MDGVFVFLFFLGSFGSLVLGFGLVEGFMEWKTVQAIPLPIYAERASHHTLAIQRYAGPRVTEFVHDSRAARKHFPNNRKV